MAISTLAAKQKMDESLYARIGANNEENLQIHRFNESLVIAIETNRPLNGKVAATYPAYPIDRTGKIRKDIRLIAKIVSLKKDQSDAHIVAESNNGKKLFSSEVGEIENGRIILMSEVPGDSLLSPPDIHELEISEASKVRKVNHNFDNLTDLQRVHICINVLESFKILIREGIFPRDIKADNILIHSDTLRATPIDIDLTHETELTRAPEKTVSEQSILFSSTLDILIPILSGALVSRENNSNTLNIVNFEEIENGIDKNFDKPLNNEILTLLSKWISDDPEERGTLEEAQHAFLYSIVADILIHRLSGIYPQRDESGNTINLAEIEEEISTRYGEQTSQIASLLDKLFLDDLDAGGSLVEGLQALEELECFLEAKQKSDTEQKNAEYDKQLRILESVLEDPQFKIEAIERVSVSDELRPETKEKKEKILSTFFLLPHTTEKHVKHTPVVVLVH